MIERAVENKKTSLYAIINIGASAFRMVISEVSRDGIKEIDYLIKPLRLGVDTFSQGYISLEHVKQATEILSGFKRKLEEYKIEDYKAVCTSGVREAKNKDFFLDYVKIHSGIDLEILEPSEEIYIKYLAARLSVKNFASMEKEGVIFANIASGNVTLSVTKGNKILYSGALPYGSLRLRQMFLNVSPRKRYRAFDQYAENMVTTVTNTINSKTKVKNLVTGGSSINLLIRLFHPKEDFIYKEDLENLYKKVRTYTRQELIDELNIRDDEAEVLVPTLCIYIHLLHYTGADKFHFAKANFPSTLTMFYNNRLKDKDYYNRLRSTLLAMGERYDIDINHAKRVAKFCYKLFNGLKEIHSLGEQEYPILDTAALLYQVGSFIDPKNTTYNSYFIIKSMAIPGWSNKFIFLTASTVYLMDRTLSEIYIANNTYLSTKERLIVNKLSSILRIAVALDSGKASLIEDFDIVLHNNMILIDAKTRKEPFVELFNFDKQKTNFEETFGIPIDIRAKVSYE